MLNLSPPTDNLYKFISIFGLVVILTSVYFVVDKKDEVFKARETLFSHVRNFLYDSALLNVEYNKINSHVEDAYSMAVNNWKSKGGDSLNIDLEKIVSNSPYIKGDLEKLDVEKEKYKTHASSNVLSDVELRKETYLFRGLESNYKTIKVLCIISSILGVIITLLEFVLWYKKVQFYQDQVLKDQYRAIVNRNSPPPTP